MRVMDIVNRAIMQSGVVSSFNPDEIPEDYQQIASTLLRHDIIRGINCDRTLDVTETVVVLNPKFGYLDLVCPPPNYPFFVFGTQPMTLATVEDKVHTESGGGIGHHCLTNLLVLLQDMGLIENFDPEASVYTYDLTTAWPCDQFGKHRPVAIWTADLKLMEIEINESTDKPVLWSTDIEDYKKKLVNKKYNVPFPPMRVVEVYRATDGAELKYKHAGELVSAEFRHAQLVYTTEDYPGKIRIKLTPSYGGSPLMVVLPVPVTVVNSYDEPNPWEGWIYAPDKFEAYLVAALAWALAGFYGVTTEARLEKATAKIYQTLLRNPSKKNHAQDIPRKIAEYLSTGGGWQVGATGSGYNGGYYV